MPKLVNSKTKAEIKIGDKVITFHGDAGVLKGFTKPHNINSTGRVEVLMENAKTADHWYPSVINAEIVLEDGE